MNCPFALPKYQFGFSSKEERKKRKKERGGRKPASKQLLFFQLFKFVCDHSGPSPGVFAQVSPAERHRNWIQSVLPDLRKRHEIPKRRCSNPQRRHWGGGKGGGKAALFLSQLHKGCFQLWIGCREGKVLTGWSASKSDPYISTRFAHLSKSEIFFGNQGMFSMSREGMESTRLLITPKEETLLVVVTAQSIN